MHQANVSNFTVVDTTPAKQVKSTPTLKVVDSPKTHRLNENLAIIKEVLNGNYNRAQEYTGMGGLQKELCTRQSELINTLGQERTNQLIESATSGYFTPVKLVDYTYDIIRQLGFTGGRILEPSCGAGVFLSHMPKDLAQNSQITAIEKEPLSWLVAKAKHQHVDVLNMGFESYQEKGFDLIIGNPPYGSHCVYDQTHLDLKNKAIHHYFVAKSARLLNDNGLIAMVLPTYILDNYRNHARNEIAKHVELVTAYRLPDTLFTGARVTVDIAIFQKVANPSKDWVEVKTIELANQKRFFMSNYFVENPSHIIGQLDSYSVWLQNEKRERTGIKCIGTMQEVIQRLPTHINRIHPVKLATGVTQDNLKNSHVESAKTLIKKINDTLKILESCIA